jgi:glucose-6-phosphate dehydrogenase assembly protein OpcA
MVTFTARGAEAVKRLPGAVLPLLLPNLPSFLWWQNRSPFRHPALSALAPALDRLIVDSLSFAAPDHDLADLAHAVAEPNFVPTVSDLAWARLAPWRYHTAQIFDAAAARSSLERLHTVTVRYHSGPPVLAWLYAGWLASRLGWEVVERGVQAMRFRGGQVVRFEALARLEPLGPGFFAGARLEADDGAVFEVSRVGATHTVSHITLGGREAERVVPLRAEALTEWLGHELGRLAPVPTYTAALHLLAAKSEANPDVIG